MIKIDADTDEKKRVILLDISLDELWAGRGVDIITPDETKYVRFGGNRGFYLYHEGIRDPVHSGYEALLKCLDLEDRTELREFFKDKMI